MFFIAEYAKKKGRGLKFFFWKFQKLWRCLIIEWKKYSIADVVTNDPFKQS